jgi:4-amino-4-deoxy-L-arabinose transferase-like glycosyltransferase
MIQKRQILYFILAAYVILASIYSIVTPIFEASDELWHYPMVKYLADHGLSLPPQDRTNPGPWRQEGSQPPLYYMMAAVLTGGIDTSDIDNVRRINPHADIGIIRPDGNANMIVHRQADEAFPWHGTTLAVHIIRFFSIVLGLGTVLVTYKLAHEIFSDWPLVALGAAALNAFLPMFLFISGSVNNDNLSNLLGNLLTLLIVRLVRTPLPLKEEGEKKIPFKRFTNQWCRYIVIGIVTGAGLLAKLNIGFLIPLVGLALLIVSIRQRDWRPLVIGGVISGGLTIVIAGWWYLRNAQVYGDPTGLNMFLEMVGRRAVYANLPQLWSERNSFTQAYWGFFGGVNVPPPDWVYLVFNIISVIGLIGAIAFIIYRILQKTGKASFIPTNSISFQWLPALVTIIWPVVTFVSYLRWTAETPASQGRLVFGALSAISMWMAVGLVWWLPKKMQLLTMTGSAGYFGIIATVTPFLVIAPMYAQPPAIEIQTTPVYTFTTPSGGSIGIIKSEVLTEVAQPEGYVNINSTLQITKPLDRDWSLFVHLVTPDGVIISQRDVYPGEGKLATSDLQSGYTWDNPVSIWIPATAYAPMKLNVEIGWYDLQTGERMKLADGAETLTIGQVDLQPRTDAENLDVPNPIRINFDNQIELVGYEITDLSPTAGDTVELTLYWRAMQKITQDYKIFANILDPKTLTKYAASDGMPVNWNAPTTTWKPGEIIKDAHTLKVDPNTPPGIYETEIGWYLQAEDGSFPRLRIVTPDGGMADSYLNLSRVRVVTADSQP